MDTDKSFRVWKLASKDAPPPACPPFAVNAASPKDAASQIAMELSMGGHYHVHAADTPGDAWIIRIVPATIYVVEALPTKADAP